MKIATTIDEQISIIQERGMLLDEGDKKAKEELTDIGYFRLGFYCFPFEQAYPNIYNRNHVYKNDSKFSDVIKLYYLDVDLRNILMKHINRIEINFRTNITYTVSNKYKNSSTWFVNPTIMHKSYIDLFDSKVYNDNFKRNFIIKNHHFKYINDKYAPAWKTLEFLTFGGILTIYKHIKDDSLKEDISRFYGIQNVKVFESYFKSIVDIRNVCAHGGVLFDFNLPLSIKTGPALKIENSNKNVLYSAVQVIIFILEKISANRSNDLKLEVAELFDKHKENAIIKSIIETKIGYKF